jgi:hypothetical protein
VARFSAQTIFANVIGLLYDRHRRSISQPIILVFA